MSWTRIYNGQAEIRFQTNQQDSGQGVRFRVAPVRWSDYDELWDAINRIKDELQADEISLVEPDGFACQPLTPKDVEKFFQMGFDDDFVWRKTDRGARSLETELRVMEERLARNGMFDGFDWDGEAE